VNYPGARNRQLTLRPEQVPQVREALQRYRQAKDTLEAISELNQYLLRLDRDESRDGKS
jgi:response regulator of citrate/malate metabolism